MSATRPRQVAATITHPAAKTRAATGGWTCARREDAAAPGRWPEHAQRSVRAVNGHTSPGTHVARRWLGVGTKDCASGRVSSAGIAGAAIPARANSALRNASSKGALCATTTTASSHARTEGSDLLEGGARAAMSAEI